MLKNYFKIPWRHILKHKSYNIINLTGLAVGICSCLIIFLIAGYEFSFDRFHPDGNRIYRIVGNMQGSSGENRFLNSTVSEVAGFKDQIPGFESKAGLILYWGSISIPNGDDAPRKFDNHITGTRSPAAVITWPEYFDIFKYEWLAGTPQSLNNPFSVVLTEKRAIEYFGHLPVQEIMGKTVIYDDSLRVRVSGIIKDWTNNTDLGYTDFISISSATHSFLKARIPSADWTSLFPHNAMAFVKLNEEVSADQVNARFAAYIEEHVQTPAGSKLSMFLQPLHDIHFADSFRRGDDGDDFRKAYLPTLYVLMGVALFILLLAVINFINLSTAHSIRRAKEIGIRKVLGSDKKAIAIQFLLETFFLSTLAAIFAVLLANPVLELFKDYIPVGVRFLPMSKSTLSFLLATVFLTTLLAGFYPAKILAGYLPVLSLKGAAIETIPRKINLRKSLTVFQLTVSLVFIIGAIVVGQQINFMVRADKGFNPKGVITVNNFRNKNGTLAPLKEEFGKISGVEKVIIQGFQPMGFARMSSTYKFKGQEEITIQPVLESGTQDYIPFYEMQLLAGRNILKGDSLKEVVVNETLAKIIGCKDPQEAIGKLLYSTGTQPEQAYPIVGVVADFHQGSFHDAIEPVVIGDAQLYHSLAAKLSVSQKDPDAVKGILTQMESSWKKLNPGETFDYSFLNESIGWLYGQDRKTAWLVNAAMIVTIFISCMGLLGLSLFTAQRRKKEIGIRKVLGATAFNITRMLSMDFLNLVGTAFLIACPVAYFLSYRWLEGFAYRTGISVWIFVVAAIALSLIGILTIIFQAIRAAIVSPSSSLRTE